MFAIEIELLSGVYTATVFNRRTDAEWPPHPARLYFAMVASWAESGRADEGEADALRWLESLSPPTITCSIEPESGGSGLARRSVTTHYVPANDTAVVRDLSSTYVKLQEASENVAAAERVGDVRALSKASTALSRITQKARRDSASAAASGLAPEKAIAILPDERVKQARTFPAVRPTDPKVLFVWHDSTADSSVRAKLDGLLARVGRLGHSSTLVSCRVVDDVVSMPSLVPHENGASSDHVTIVRVPGIGQLDRLRELYDSHQGSQPRTLPVREVAYGWPDRAVESVVPQSYFSGGWLPYVIDGPSVPVRSSVRFAEIARVALMSWAGRVGDVPELISGHLARGSGDTKTTAQSRRPHVAIVPLPFVGHPHADGLLKGFAIVVPRRESWVERDEFDAQYETLKRTLGRWLPSYEDTSRAALWGGEFGEDCRWHVTPAIDGYTPATIQARRWCTFARTWVSVTPIALDKYPDGLWRGTPQRRARAEAQAQASIARACEQIGLPTPEHVAVRSDPPVTGTVPASQFVQFRSGPTNALRFLVHAVIEFASPVRGPILLGRGRHLGLGLFFPIEPGKETR